MKKIQNKMHTRGERIQEYGVRISSFDLFQLNTSTFCNFHTHMVPQRGMRVYPLHCFLLPAVTGGEFFIHLGGFKKCSFNTFDGIKEKQRDDHRATSLNQIPWNFHQSRSSTIQNGFYQKIAGDHFTHRQD